MLLKRVQTDTPSGSPLKFNTLYGTRAPEFDFVIGAFLGEMSLEMQLGYWDGIMDEALMMRYAKMYKAIVEEWVNGDGLEGSVDGLKALSI